MENNAVKRIERSMPTTKAGVETFAIDINKQLEDGEISGLELLKTFKMIEKLQEYVKDKMIAAALKEADQHPGKDLEAFGVSFKKIEAGTKYDFSNCNDVQHREIMRTEEKLKAEKKKREDFLKTIDGSLTIQGKFVDTDSGEEIVNPVLYPPTKISTSTLQVIIK